VLSKRSDKRELKIEQKMDQKMMDEFAMRASINRQSNRSIK
jgi:flagellar biosynthesis chaperone FliJ